MKRKAITLCLLYILPGVLIRGQSQTAFPSLEPDPRAEAYFRRGDRAHSWEELAEISLWASGSGQTGSSGGPAAGTRPSATGEQPSFMDSLRDAAGELGAAPDLPREPRARGEYILTYMHKKFLKSYSLQQTRIDTLLSNGRYNCVSSAVFYLILGTAAGLEVRGVMTRDHAFAVVNVNGVWIDVETTNPYGFDPGNRKEFHDQFGRATGFAYVPAKNYRDRVFISPIELVSLILSNRVADLESRGRFAEAVPLAISRAGLLEGRGEASPGGVSAPEDAAGPAPFFENPRQDLMNRIFNFGASLLKAGKEEDALRWADFAGARYPDEERWQEFIFTAMNNRLVKLTRAGRFAEARDSLTLQAPALREADFDRLNRTLTDAELLDRASNIKDAGEAESVLAAIDQAEARGLAPAARAEELRTFAIEKTAALLAAPPGRNWPAAIACIAGALEKYGPNRRLEQSLQNYRSNLAADYHNRFAAAWNRKDYAEAERILAEGLELFPDNRRLLADRLTAEKARGTLTN